MPKFPENGVLLRAGQLKKKRFAACQQNSLLPGPLQRESAVPLPAGGDAVSRKNGGISSLFESKRVLQDADVSLNPKKDDLSRPSGRSAAEKAGVSAAPKLVFSITGAPGARASSAGSVFPSP